MSQNFQNPFTMWADMNKQAFDTWSTWAANTMQQVVKTDSENDSEGKTPFDAYYDFFKKNFVQNPMFAGLYGEASNNLTDQMYKQWTEGMKSMSAFIPNQTVKDGFDRFFSSYQMFSGLQSYWDSILKNFPTDMKDWDSFTKSVMKQYQNLSGGFLAAFIPEQLKNFFTMPSENFTTMQQSLMQFFKPWIEDSTVLHGYLTKAMLGDREAYAEFMKEWAKVYKSSFSKMLNVPAIGANRVSIEKMMKLLDDYVNFVIIFNEFNLMISNMMTGAMEKLLAHLAELQSEGNQPQTFMEFYKIWSKFNEQAFMELYATDEFSKIMNETVSAGSKLQILCDDFVQDILAFLPLPNKREFDDVAHEVYQLRKKVKVLEKELKALKEQAPPDKK
jgi:class III poly(R)-hydroxyalkanoic acid synthase PhaE subunit